MPRHNCPAGRRGHQLEGAAPIGIIILVSGLVLALAAVVYWMSGPSPEELLAAESLTPKQIRIVATKLLLHSDPKIRIRASEKLASLGDTAVPVLKEVGLARSDTPLRLAVYNVLALIDAGAAGEILQDMITDSDPEVRRHAVGAASRLRHPRAVAVLEKALSDENIGIRSAAAGSLSRPDAASAIPSLRAALNDPNLSVARHAARSLKALTGRDYSQQIEGR